jgi:ribosomal-protein-alanine N-acetyltransferase
MTGAAAPPPGIVLRDMRWWDIPPVLALEQELFSEDSWSAGMFWSELADTRHPQAGRRYLVAERGAEVVGYAGLFASTGEADVQTIASARSEWGNGLGPALLAELIAEAARRGCPRMLLEVRTDNLRAQRLYTRFGFEPLGIRRNYYAEAGVDALVMQLTAPAEALENYSHA